MDRFVAIINSDPSPPQVFRRDECGSRTREAIQHQVTRLGGRADDLLQHFNILFGRIAGYFDVLVVRVLEIQPDVLDGNPPAIVQINLAPGIAVG